MDFQYTIFSEILDEDEIKAELQETLEILKKHSITEVEILFGFAWGVEYKDYTPFKVHVNEIISEIEKAENFEFGNLGDDDFWITINQPEMEILFCHEGDIHLLFNTENDILKELVNNLKVKEIFQRQVKNHS